MAVRRRGKCVWGGVNAGRRGGRRGAITGNLFFLLVGMKMKWKRRIGIER